MLLLAGRGAEAQLLLIAVISNNPPDICRGQCFRSHGEAEPRWNSGLAGSRAHAQLLNHVVHFEEIYYCHPR